jgi:hypothetical protein
MVGDLPAQAIHADLGGQLPRQFISSSLSFQVKRM